MPILDLPFIYPVTGTLRGKRAGQTYWVRDTLPVDLQDRTQSEVGTVRGFAIDSGASLWTLGVENGRTVRPLHAPSSYSFDNGRTRPATRQEFERILAHVQTEAWRWLGYPLELLSPYDEGRHKTTAAKDLNFRVVEHNGRDAYAASAADALSGGVLIDDVVNLPAEPVWQVYETNTADQHVRVHLGLATPAETPHGALFRADRLDDAMAYAQRESERVGKPIAVQHRLDGVEHMACRFDDVGAAIEKAAKKVWLKCAGPTLRDMPLSFFAHFFELKDLMETKRLLTGEDAPRFHRLARGMLDAVKEERTKRSELEEALEVELSSVLWRLDGVGRRILAEPDLDEPDAVAIAGMR